MTLLFDATHTSHTRAQTGIQRVVRSLARELAQLGRMEPVCFDPHQHAWRALDTDERTLLAHSTGASGSRGAKWSLRHQVIGRVRRLAGRTAAVPRGHGLVCPELFSARAAAEFPALFAAVRGPRVAIFHDAIGLKFPELTPPATVARLPAYLRELALFDGVAAVSEDSAASLREFWAWSELPHPPPVVAIPLGLDPQPARPLPDPATTPRVLCVSTIEGRKNHLALLEAAEGLWRQGVKFELELIGLPRADTGDLALAKLKGLQAQGYPLVYHGTVSDAKLHEAYARSAFTIYPSLYEGFGLPVLESLQHGRPCICGRGGALAEAARGGGVLTMETPTAAHLGRAMRRLLEHPAERSALAAAARARPFRSWRDYATDLRTWMDGLKSA